MKNKLVFLAAILGLLSCLRLFRPGFYSTQDEMHIFRLEQFDKCFHDLQIPCRYVPDAGFGYGYPLFNFYAPAFYFLAEIFHLIGFSFTTSVKIILILIKIGGGVGLFLLSRSLLATALFTFAPYQATNLFVRGAFPELLALNLIPWVFYFFKNKNYPWAAFSLALLFLSHSLTSLAVLILLIPYLFFFVKDYKHQLFTFLTAFGLAAFFLLPAFWEKNLTTMSTMTQDYFNYTNHFTTLHQLFISRSWGYGASLWGPNDDMAFSVGWLQWLIPLITLIVLILTQKNSKPFLFFSFFALFFLFLTHNKSTFIWQTFPFMAYFQFPWRFLGIAVFCLSLASSFLPLRQWLAIIFIILTIVTNFNYFKEDIWYQNYNLPITKVSGEGLKDYWPKYGQNFPTEYITNPLYTKKSNQVTTDLNLTQKTDLLLPVVYFPNMKLFINQQEHPYTIDSHYGQVKTTLNPGSYNLKLIFYNTPIRTIANFISLLALFFLPYLWRLKEK